MQETLFRLQKHKGCVFSRNKKNCMAAPYRSPDWGCSNKLVTMNPNIQISNLEVPVGMVDGILTKLRNPVNQDLWLTDRFSTSVNHFLFLTLYQGPGAPSTTSPYFPVCSMHLHRARRAPTAHVPKQAHALQASLALQAAL